MDLIKNGEKTYGNIFLIVVILNKVIGDYVQRK
jgi:hypothetical protein